MVSEIELLLNHKHMIKIYWLYFFEATPERFAVFHQTAVERHGKNSIPHDNQLLLQSHL